MFGDTGYLITKGPDLWRLLQALAGNKDGRPQPVFAFREDPAIDCDWEFACPCLSLLGLRRLDAEGVNWRIEGYFDIRASDPGQFWFEDHATRHLVGVYNSKTRKGRLRDWDSKYAQEEELPCPDDVKVPEGTLREVPLKDE